MEVVMKVMVRVRAVTLRWRLVGCMYWPRVRQSTPTARSSSMVVLTWCTVHGVCCMVYAVWFMLYGASCMVHVCMYGA